MNLSQLEYFVTSASCHSFSQAAKKLYISQPNLSKTIEQLEAELGIKLFNRTNKGIVLTDEGSEFLIYANQILNQVENVEEYYQIRKERQYYLSVSCQPFDAVFHAVCDFQNKYEKQHCLIQVNETNRMQVIKDVASNQSEIGILVTSSWDPLRFRDAFSNNQLEYNMLDDKPAVVYFSKNSPLSNYQHINNKILESYNRIYYNIDTFTENKLSDNQTILRTNSSFFTKELLNNPHNYLIQTIWDKEIFSDQNISNAILDEPSIKVQIGYCVSKTRQHSQELEKFIDYLKLYF